MAGHLRKRIEIHVRVRFLDCLLQFVDLHASVADLHFFAEVIGAPVFAVVIEIDRPALGRILKSEFSGEIVDHLVPHEGRIKRIGEEDPFFRLLASALRIQKVRLLSEFQLIGLLPGGGPGGVSAAFQGIDLSLIEKSEVFIKQEDFARRRIALDCVDVSDVFVGIA